MKIALVASWARSVINFRGPLVREAVRRGHRVVAFCPNQLENIEARFAELGADWCSWDVQRTGTSAIKDIQALVALHRQFKHHRPDVVLSYTLKPVLYGSLAGAGAGVTTVASMVTGLGYLFVSNSPMAQTLRATTWPMYRFAFHCNSTVFFQNPDDRDEFVQRGLVPHTKTRVVAGSGVDLSHWQRAPLPAGPTRFLFLGRFLFDKGIRELIDAIRLLRRRGHKPFVQLVGKTDPNPSCVPQAQLDLWAAEGLVELADWHDDARQFLRDTHVVVLPSYREGTPRSVLEALAVGRAVITTDVPGCRETVLHGHSGLLVPPRDARSLADAMEKLIVRPELVPSMASRGHELARNKYEATAVARSVLDPLGL